MTTSKKPWQEPQVRSIADLSAAYGAPCQIGSTAAGGNCTNGATADITKRCACGNTARQGGSSPCQPGG